ncbi:MAG: POT family MFS transporter [Pseudomonadota bacterium]
MHRYPPQIKYIIGNEAAERFSFYGMRSILTIFMVQYLAFSAADAQANYHYFISAVYLTPLLGAYIADRFLGKYKTILYLSCIYCLGHLILAIWETRTAFLIGLGCIALGSGGIKPCVSAHVGDQFTASNKHLLRNIYSIFYFSINFGAFFSSLLIPWVLPKFGPAWAFGIPGILMAFATFIFWLGRKHYIYISPTKNSGEPGFIAIVWYALKNFKNTNNHWLDVAKNKFTETHVENVKSVAAIFKIFIFVSGFWALFDQYGSSWVLQAEQMNRQFLGMTIESSQLQALNPVFVMLLIPLFMYGIYPFCEKIGLSMTPLRRMTYGMFLAALSFIVVGILQIFIDKSYDISIGWQIIAYLILTMSEVMVSITGLEFAYTQAPKSMKSTIMSFWLLTVFIGNFFTASISKINSFEGANYFFFFAGIMVIFSIMFTYLARQYVVRDQFTE